MDKSFNRYTKIFKAISDDTRLKIIDMLSCGEMCACDILEEFHITQSTLSYHMKILSDSGVVNSRKDGSWMKYTLNNEVLEETLLFLKDLTSEKEDCVCRKYK